VERVENNMGKWAEEEQKMNKKVKKPKSIEEAKVMLIRNLEKLLKDNNISAIVSIPGSGTFGIFKNEADCLLILNHAKIEQEKIDLHNKYEAKRLLMEEQNNEKTEVNKPNYV